MKKGEVKKIYNRNLSGEEIVEGYAELIEKKEAIGGRLEKWKVKFENGDIVDRIVDDNRQ